MNTWDEQLFEMIGRMRQQNRGSKAAAVVTPCPMMVANNPNRNKSKAASVGVQRVNKAKVIYDFLNSKQY